MLWFKFFQWVAACAFVFMRGVRLKVDVFVPKRDMPDHSKDPKVDMRRGDKNGNVLIFERKTE